MILWLLAYVGGVLTILSPCILPVLPFVLSRADQSFRRSGLPLLAGMAAMFALVSSFAVVGGSWVVHANEWGRWLALTLLSLFAVTLLFPSAAEWISRPFTRLGGTLHQSQSEERGIFQSFVLGAATGLLWAPCTGPILGLILTSAVIKGANVSTTILLVAYALGAATSLAVALLAGNRVLKSLRGYLGVDVWVRRLVGSAVLLGVLTIALGWDRTTLTRLSRFQTEVVEQKLVRFFHREADVASSSAAPAIGIDPFPELAGADLWINSPELSPATLRGKVVMVDFWTYSCINCLRTLPYVKAWYQKYKENGFVVVGVHTPEFAFEKNPENVRKAVRELGLSYPVALDNRYQIWNAFKNRYWPAHYFIDASGNIRHTHFGEGGYEESEKVIQKLISETGAETPSGFVRVSADGSQAPSPGRTGSPETYVGYHRAENQASIPPVVRDAEAHYSLPDSLQRNQWGLSGRWKVQKENAALARAPGKIVFRFHARDLHLVLGPGPEGKPISFVVRLDGKAPGKDHGTDIDDSGHGVIGEQRLYQLIRQQGNDAIKDRTFEIEFLTPGAQAFAFTFG